MQGIDGPTREVFTRDEAAEFARVKPGKIDQWLDAGLMHIRTGSAAGKSGPAGIIILREHLMDWIRALAARPSAAEGAVEAVKRGRGRPRIVSETQAGGRHVS